MPTNHEYGFEKKGVWNFISLFGYNGPNKREFIGAAAQNYFDETAIKEL